MRLVALLAALLIAGCSTAPERKGGYYKDDGPHEKVPDNLSAIPDAEPKSEPLHRFANRPYQVFGKDYVPFASVRPFRQRGMASWYGKRFHGQKTASGELYDMYAMTAAHPTLPIPSYARVTHLRSSKSVVVRINDRGPFHAGRIIDLSYAAAHKLGFIQHGSSEVEVEAIVPGRTAGEEKVFLQVGAFSSRDNAESLRARVQALEESAQLLLAGNLWRLQLGPYRSQDDARTAAERLERAFELKPLIVVR
jgi:rare lipoprotein A